MNSFWKDKIQTAEQLLQNVLNEVPTDKMMIQKENYDETDIQLSHKLERIDLTFEMFSKGLTVTIVTDEVIPNGDIGCTQFLFFDSTEMYILGTNYEDTVTICKKTYFENISLADILKNGVNYEGEIDYFDSVDMSKAEFLTSYIKLARVKGAQYL